MSEIRVTNVIGENGNSPVNFTQGINMSGICTAPAFIPSQGQLSHRNKVINGAMTISQRGTSFASASQSNVYHLDRFKLNGSNDGAVTISQSSTSPDGFSNSYKVDVTTADTSIAAGQYIQINHRIEGQNLQDLAYGTSAAKTITVSFYVRSNLTGTYTFAMQQPDNSFKQMSQTYTIDSANTWERKTFTVVGDTSGVLNNDNGDGISMFWNLAIGSNYTTGSSSSSFITYGATNFAAGHTANLLSSTSNEWYLTGVQLEVGSVATPFEHRSYGEELQRCQRYFFNITGNTGSRTGIPGYANSTTSLRAMVQFPTPMRAIPTISGSSTAMILDSHDDSASFNCSSLTAGGAPTTSNPTQMCIEVNTSGMTNGQGGQLEFRASNGFINFDAEL